ncbi:inositol monophosphatase family protein [Humibacter ginsengisoli]
MTATGLRVRACAHRGDSSRYRENTLPAIRSAIASGAGFVEIDVRVTRDGQVVVVHDPTFERLWNLPQPVAETTWDEVLALGDADHRPLSLGEVLELFDGVHSTLLIDMDDASFAAPAHAVIASESAGASIAWCGDLDGMRMIRALDPDARIWMPWSRTTPPTDDDLGDLRPECINTPFAVMSPGLVDDIHRLGLDVTVWTVDDDAVMRWAIRTGVDTVTTNRLGRFQSIATDAEERSGADPAEELDRAHVVARSLAEWAVEYTSAADLGTISTKRDAADLVTEVDTAVERQVREVIAAQFPDHDFVGEEFGGSERAGVPCWYLDPVDGTANLANGVPWNAFSLALVVDHEPVVSVVADPWRGDVFDARRGAGARLNGHPLRLRDAAPSDGDPLRGRIVSTELANQHPWPGMVSLLRRLGDRYCTMRIMGSGTLTLTGVATGRGVGAVIGSFGAVDHLAAILIVQEAGGLVLGEDGSPTSFPASGGVLAAAPWAADALYAEWKAAIREDEYLAG